MNTGSTANTFFPSYPIATTTASPAASTSETSSESLSSDTTTTSWYSGFTSSDSEGTDVSSINGWSTDTANTSAAADLSSDLSSVASAGTPEYKSTQKFMDYLVDQGIDCTYRGKRDETSEMLQSVITANNLKLNIISVFSSETDCAMYAVELVSFEGKNQSQVSEFVDALNAEYRFVRFYTSPDEMINATLDLLFTDSTVEEICFDGFRRLVNICDEVYPSLALSISELVSDSAASSGLELTTTYASGTGTTTPTSTPEPQAVLMKVKTRPGGTVNVRQTPDANGLLVGTVDGNTTLDCLSVASNGWYEVRLSNGMTGYISNKKASEVK
ncbi:MAG: SH3 domain-containing protein [Clostridia bacterium]|nr:SH3 domain-containing protein [Clostridia bacterium]